MVTARLSYLMLAFLPVLALAIAPSAVAQSGIITSARIDLKCQPWKNTEIRCGGEVRLQRILKPEKAKLEFLLQPKLGKLPVTISVWQSICGSAGKLTKDHKVDLSVTQEVRIDLPPHEPTIVYVMGDKSSSYCIEAFFQCHGQSCSEALDIVSPRAELWRDPLR